MYKWNPYSIVIEFFFTSLDAGVGEITVTITDPEGNDASVKPVIELLEPSVYRVSYTATLKGVHKIQVTFAGEQIPKSPYSVDISLRK